MTPDRFLQKLVEVIAMIKVPTLIIIFIIALVQVLTATFISGHDKRENFTTVASLMIMAAIIFYTDKFVIWLSHFVGR
ncbi:MAG: hypothetical protein ROO73_01200 [Roseivirga sp.]